MLTEIEKIKKRGVYIVYYRLVFIQLYLLEIKKCKFKFIKKLCIHIIQKIWEMSKLSKLSKLYTNLIHIISFQTVIKTAV